MKLRNGLNSIAKNERGIGIVALMGILTVLVAILLSSFGMLSLRTKSQKRKAEREDLLQLQQLLKENIDCVGTFAKNSINADNVAGKCGSTSAGGSQVAPFLRLKRRVTTPGTVSFLPEVVGKYRLQASCSYAERSLVVRADSAAANPPDFYGERSLLIGGTAGQGAIYEKKQAQVFPLCTADFPNAVPVTAIRVGSSFTCSIQAGGVKCWGDAISLGSGGSGNMSNPLQVTGLTSGVTNLALGSSHGCAVVSGGVKCWGLNTSGQLGNGVTGGDGGSHQTVPVTTLGIPSGATELAAGWDHTCAIVNGGVKCWGGNAHGQLGDGTTTDRLTPVNVSGIAAGATAIGGTQYGTCAVVSGGLKCWGMRIGQWPFPDDLTPFTVTGLETGVTHVGGGNAHLCVVQNGGVKCWGDNWATLPLCIGWTGGREPNPTAVPGLGTGVTAIARGLSNSGGGAVCAVKDGGAKCCRGATPTIQDVPGLATGVIDIVATGHGCALMNTTPLCWGTNGSGQLGDGTTTNRTDPVYVLY